MKKPSYLFNICLLFCLTACTQLLEETVQPPIQSKYDRDVYTISQMGYDISDIYRIDSSYVVEKHILITQRHIRDFERIPQTRQGLTNGNTLSEENREVYLNYTGWQYNNAYTEAANYWNTKSKCGVQFHVTGIENELRISEESMDDESILMLVSPPTASGELGGEIIFNTDCKYKPDPNSSQAMYMMLHAMGHAIGFGHTFVNNGDNIKEDFGKYPIDGIEHLRPDSKSIMAEESDPLGWSGFSENDIKAFKAIYPTDEPEPEPEPEPDIDPSIPWIYSQDDFDIELSVRDFSEDTPYVFQNYVKQTGDFWYYHENKQKYIRITDANGRVVALGKANESYSIPYGEYTLQYGVLVESVLCGEAKVKFWQTQPRIWTNARENETIDLTREYVVKCEFDTNSPDWQEYTKSVKMVDTGTTEEVPLRFSETADRWYFRFPDRGTYKIILTVTNRLGETKTAEKTLQITSIDRTPVFYKMYEEYVGIEYGYLKNNEAVSRFSLRFYSDAACTRRIASTENTIECSYILWDDYYDIDSEPVSSTIQEQGTFLIPVGSSTCELPHDIFNGTPYTLDQPIFRYEITGFYYK